MTFFSWKKTWENHGTSDMEVSGKIIETLRVWKNRPCLITGWYASKTSLSGQRVGHLPDRITKKSDDFTHVFPHIFVWGSCFWFCIPGFSSSSRRLRNKTHTNLTYNNFTHTNLTHTNLTDNNFTHTNLTHTHTNLTHTNLTDNNFTHTQT